MAAAADVNTMELESAWTLRGAEDAPRGELVREIDSEPTAPQAPPALPQQRDWSGALALVAEAAEAIRLGEERLEDLRREADEQNEQYHADLKALHAQLVGAQREIEAANLRAQAAEQRAREAAEWLARLDDSIRNHFGGIDRST